MISVCPSRISEIGISAVPSKLLIPNSVLSFPAFCLARISQAQITFLPFGRTWLELHAIVRVL